MTRLFLSICWFACTLFALGQSSPSVFRMPDKPKGHVSDESNWLSEQERFVWERQLEQWKNNEDVEIFLVVLPSLQNTPAEHVMREIANQWGQPELRGVVLYIPQSVGPRIWWDGEVMGKVNLDPRAQREMILRMEKRSGSELTERDRVASAIYELSDTMRVINSQWKQIRVLRDKWNDNIYRKLSKERMISRGKWIAVGSVSLLLLVSIAWLIRRQLIFGRKYSFPRVSAQRRFGAMHAGGSGAIVSLQSSRHRL